MPPSLGVAVHLADPAAHSRRPQEIRREPKARSTRAITRGRQHDRIDSRLSELRGVQALVVHSNGDRLEPCAFDRARLPAPARILDGHASRSLIAQHLPQRCQAVRQATEDDRVFAGGDYAVPSRPPGATLAPFRRWLGAAGVSARNESVVSFDGGLHRIVVTEHRQARRRRARTGEEMGQPVIHIEVKGMGQSRDPEGHIVELLKGPA
jgi:hypothetical protein